MGKARLLIVEDDIDISTMLRIYFSSQGYDVDVAGRGSEALEKTRHVMPHLIILDIMLPEQRGDQILDALRNDAVDLVPNSKFLVMTNFEQNDRDRETMLKRVDGYLIKADITPRRLLEVIEELGRS